MKMKTIVSIFVVCIIVFSVTAYSAYVLATKDERLSTNISDVQKISVEKSNNEQQKKENEEEVEKDYKTTYDTNLIFNHKYIDDGHEEIVEKPLNASMKGLTINELKKIYSDWNITAYDDENIYLEKNFNTVDNSKYTIGIKDGYVTVFENKSGQLHLYMSTKKSINNLYDNDLMLLNKGIKVFSDGELLKILEDFES